MAIRITLYPDYPIDPLDVEVVDMLQIFSLGVHMKPRSVVEAMVEKRHLCGLDEYEFGQACRWVLHGNTHDIYHDTDILSFVMRRCVEVLKITHEQELEINQVLRDIVAMDRAYLADPYPLPEC